MSSSASDVWMQYSYSFGRRRLKPSHAKVRSTIQVRPATLNARCLRLTIFKRNLSRRSCRASLRLSCPASAMMVRMVGQSGARPANSLPPAFRSEMLAGSTRLAMGKPTMSTKMWRVARGSPAPTFLQRSLRPLLTVAACSGLRPAPDCRPRGAHPHLSYSSTPPFPSVCS